MNLPGVTRSGMNSSWDIVYPGSSSSVPARIWLLKFWEWDGKPNPSSVISVRHREHCPAPAESWDISKRKFLCFAQIWMAGHHSVGVIIPKNQGKTGCWNPAGLPLHSANFALFLDGFTPWIQVFPTKQFHKYPESNAYEC